MLKNLMKTAGSHFHDRFFSPTQSTGGSTRQGTAFSLAPDHHSSRLRERGKGTTGGADLAHVDQVAVDLITGGFPMARPLEKRLKGPQFAGWFWENPTKIWMISGCPHLWKPPTGVAL